MLDTTMNVNGAMFDDNDTGILLTQYGGSYQPTATVGIYGNTFAGNVVGGIDLIADNAYQNIAVQGNGFANPAGSVGISADATNVSTQNINVHTNTQTGGTDYSFSSFGAIQNVTY
jgi:hypothetical protein